MADDASVRIAAGTEGREVIALWSAPPPRQIEGYPASEEAWVPPLGLAERKVFLRNVAEPSLTVFSPEPARANGVGVIVCPGGGWQVLAWEHEGLEVARWLNGRGYTAFLLKYRVSPTPASLDAFIAQQASVGALTRREADLGAVAPDHGRPHGRARPLRAGPCPGRRRRRRPPGARLGA